MARGDEEINLLTSADERVAGVVGVQHHEAGRANWVEREADVHLSRLSLVGSVQLAGVLVLVVQPHLLAVRQLSELSNLFEAELIGGELISKASRPARKPCDHQNQEVGAHRELNSFGSPM